MAATVFDEHGTMVGIAFLEDALEEIVGPIHDEFDEKSSRIDKPAPGIVEFAGPGHCRLGFRAPGEPGPV